MPLDDHELGKILGRLEQQNEAAEKARFVIHKKQDDLDHKTNNILLLMQELKGGTDRLEKRINDEIVPHIDDYRKVKQRGIGVLIATGITAGGLGAATFKYLTAIFKG